MNVSELHEALGQMIEDGHGDAEVAHVNGQGKASRVLGWELVTSSRYEPVRGADQQAPNKQLKLYTTSRF